MLSLTFCFAYIRELILVWVVFILQITLSCCPVVTVLHPILLYVLISLLCTMAKGKQKTITIPRVARNKDGFPQG